jgi:hypothetical protein
MNTPSLLSPFASVKAMRRYAKCDFELWYNLTNVIVEAGMIIAASARLA